jgi:hypothetical protein
LEVDVGVDDGLVPDSEATGVIETSLDVDNNITDDEVELEWDVIDAETDAGVEIEALGLDKPVADEVTAALPGEETCPNVGKATSPSTFQTPAVAGGQTGAVAVGL